VALYSPLVNRSGHMHKGTQREKIIELVKKRIES
jgi:hypothetical protein